MIAALSRSYSGGMLMENRLTYRLGNALYWLGCGVAGLTVVSGIYWSFQTEPQNTSMVTAAIVVGILIWGAARGLRYVLSGR